MDSHTLHRGPGTWVYFVAGVLFGIVITRGEVISWFRIQEMFRFQGFHMFGVFAGGWPTTHEPLTDPFGSSKVSVLLFRRCIVQPKMVL